MDDRALLGDAAVGRLSGTCILVVDDEEEIRTFLATVLSDEGAATLEASDGAEALERAARAQPDLITLDLSMPGTDGIEAFERLRSNPATGEIPICIITGHPEFRKVLYDSAVLPPEGFLGKPCDPEHLVRTVHRIVGLRQRKHDRHDGSPARH
ncbi:MAG TPA: response regulator [Thermoanaerobaculia bacterium]|nr:response regulator [Thermoanaerobaculia bacterium]